MLSALGSKELDVGNKLRVVAEQSPQSISFDHLPLSLSAIYNLGM